MAQAISAITGRAPEDVRKDLWREFLVRGSTVRRALARLDGRPHHFDDAMARLYATSDAFLYELALWNANWMKRAMRRWVTRWIRSTLGPGQRVLTWGDGLGFDSLALAQDGHEVTSFDLPGSSRTFARHLLRGATATGRRTSPVAQPSPAKTGERTPGRRPAPVRMPDEISALGQEAFDAVVCLDVLEHVPDVAAELKRIRNCLRPGGILLVHAPFYFVHRVAVTHLRSSRRYSGSLRLFRKAGFTFRDARPTWDPLVFARSDGPLPRRSLLAGPRQALALPIGCFYALGRFTALPFELVNLVCRLAQPYPYGA